MAFEVRAVDSGPVYSGGNPVVGRFTDAEWWNLLALAHECGFDPDGEYVSVVYPADRGTARELDGRAAAGLYIGAGTILKQDTLPFATTWETEDGRLHFRWAAAPRYALDRKPEDVRGFGARDFDLDKTELRQLVEYLGEVRVLVARTEDPTTA